MATQAQTTVVAVFRNVSDAEAAEKDLLASGFDEDDIYIGSETESTFTSTTETTDTHEGGIAGWFKRIFGQDDETDRPYYENAVRSGSVVLSVDTTEDRAENAADIISRHSPADVREEGSTNTTAGAATAGTTTGRTTTAGTTPTGTARTNAAAATASETPTRQGGADQSRAIPVIEEQLQVGKRAVIKGGVRIYSRMIEQPVEESVNLTEERVRVDRQRVNRPLSEGEVGTARDEVIEVTEYAEEPVVTKQARVVEEVRVNKEATQRTQTVRDNVRRTEVNVENLAEGQANTRSGARAAATSASSDLDRDFQTDFTSRYGSTGGSYETYAPAYRYGYETASDPRYKGKNFSDVESDLKADYSSRYPNSTWEKMKDSIRYGWDKVTGRASSASSTR